MAAACATRLPHPHPGRDFAVGPQLLIRQGKPGLFLQLTSVCRGRSTIHRLWCGW